MKIVYIGSVEFSAKSLEKLYEISAHIVGVITKAASAVNSDFRDLSPVAKANGTPSHYTKNINSEDTLAWIRSLQPDVIMCFGWSNLIKKEVLEAAPMGVVGFHPALLPNNRGRHPLIWAKALGLKESGNTFFFMDEGADTGDVLSQKSFEIKQADDAGTLYQKMSDVAMGQIEEFHAQLSSGEYPRLVQDKTAGNNWRKRGMRDGEIHFKMNTLAIANLVRALTKPYVGAHVAVGENNYTVWEVAEGIGKETWTNIEPGKILSTEGTKFEVKTGDGSIWLTNHEFETTPQIGTYI
jgi:methionyl-tRNA formyltransferase